MFLTPRNVYIKYLYIVLYIAYYILFFISIKFTVFMKYMFDVDTFNNTKVILYYYTNLFYECISLDTHIINIFLVNILYRK